MLDEPTSCASPYLQIGQHFRKFGKVMDVVMVKDFGPLLSLAAEATALKEQHSQAKERSERGHNAGVQHCQALLLSQIVSCLQKPDAAIFHTLQLVHCLGTDCT